MRRLPVNPDGHKSYRVDVPPGAFVGAVLSMPLDHMSYELTIPFRLPGLNELLEAAKGAGGTGARYSRAKASHTNTIALLVKVKHWAPVARAYFTFTWHERNRQRNPDNIAAGGRKVIFDGMVRAGLLENDGWGQILGWADAFVVSPEPRVVVTIVPVGP